MRRVRSLTLASLIALGVMPGMLHAQSSTSGSAPPYDLFLTFGDSLADTGNVHTMSRLLRLPSVVPPSESPHRTYFEGRFSNGPVAFEHLWNTVRGPHAPLRPFLHLRSMPRTGGVDFAFGGSTSGSVSVTPGGFLVPGLLSQVRLFLELRRDPLPRNTLVAIATGSNDYMTNPPAAPASPADVVGNIVTAIEQLHARGARTVMVLNLGDLGTVPLMASAPVATREGLSTLAQVHNALLAEAVASLAARRPSLRVMLVDVAQVTAALPPTMNVTVPAVDALLPGWPLPFPASACLFVDASTCPDVPTFDVSPDFFFWDAVHPSAAVHFGLSRYLLTQLPAAVGPTLTSTYR